MTTSFHGYQCFKYNMLHRGLYSTSNSFILFLLCFYNYYLGLPSRRTGVQVAKMRLLLGMASRVIRIWPGLLSTRSPLSFVIWLDQIAHLDGLVLIAYQDQLNKPIWFHNFAFTTVISLNLGDCFRTLLMKQDDKLLVGA
jgi:hypothetical protein